MLRAPVTRAAAMALLAMIAGPADPLAGRSTAAADPLAGRVAGSPQRCVALYRLRGPDVLRDGRIVYRTSLGRWWVNRPVDRCPGLRPLTTLVVEVYGTEICNGDRFRAVEPGTLVGAATCRFGDFVPYDRH